MAGWCNCSQEAAPGSGMSAAWCGESASGSVGVWGELRFSSQPREQLCELGAGQRGGLRAPSSGLGAGPHGLRGPCHLQEVGLRLMTPWEDAVL